MINGHRQSEGASLRVTYSQAVPPHLRGKVREVSSLMVDQAVRGHGHATRMMRDVMSEADAEDLALLVVVEPFDDSPVDAVALRGWYSRMGFVEIQSEPCVMVRMPHG